MTTDSFKDLHAERNFLAATIFFAACLARSFYCSFVWWPLADPFTSSSARMGSTHAAILGQIHERLDSLLHHTAA
jgi:hypothetical protein